MRTYLYIAIAAAFMIAGPVACNKDTAPSTPALTIAETAPASSGMSNTDALSYGIGMDIGTKIKVDLPDLDHDIVMLGIRHAMTNTTPLMTEEQFNATIKEYQQKMATQTPQGANGTLPAGHP
jgi:hypothetical protein